MRTFIRDVLPILILAVVIFFVQQATLQKFVVDGPSMNYSFKEDGTALPSDEPYVTEPARQPFTGDTIPENEYFVLGDNRNNSSDSRNDWTLPRQNIIGKTWLSIWPPDKWGVVASYPSQE